MSGGIIFHLPTKHAASCGDVAFNRSHIGIVNCEKCLNNYSKLQGPAYHNVRTFETGATRSPLGTKPEYAGFMSPLVIKRFGQYMHDHLTQSDGTIREARNWQKGIPQAAYMDSMLRHQVDVWLYCEGHAGEMSEDIETALCAMLFNVQGMLFEILKEKAAKWPTKNTTNSPRPA